MSTEAEQTTQAVQSAPEDVAAWLDEACESARGAQETAETLRYRLAQVRSELAAVRELRERHRRLHALQSETARRAEIAEARAIDLQRQVDRAYKTGATTAEALAEIDRTLGSVDVPHARNGVPVPLIERAREFRKRSDRLAEAERERADAVRLKAIAESQLENREYADRCRAKAKPAEMFTCPRCFHLTDQLLANSPLDGKQETPVCRACVLDLRLNYERSTADQERAEAVRACTTIIGEERKKREAAESRVRYLERRLRVVQLAADPGKPMHVMAADDGDKPVNDQ